HRGERPPGAGDELAQVVAGDILHHPAARLEGFAAARHRGKTEKMVACGAGLDPARAGEIGGERAADGAAASRALQNRPLVPRLEGELLPAPPPQRLHPPAPGPRPSPEHTLLPLRRRDAAR